MDNKSNAAPATGSAETIEQKIARLTAENANLQRAVDAKATATLTVKHSTSTGVVIVGGMGRYPTSLYPDQWVKVLAFAPRIAAYLRDNAVELEQIRLSRAADTKAK